MRLNKKVELGIKAVNALKGRTVPTRAEDIASEVGTTLNFLEQIMRKLRLSEIVVVKRGPRGGYVLNPAKTVTAYDVAHSLGSFVEGLDVGDTSPANVLRLTIVDVFQNMTI